MRPHCRFFIIVVALLAVAPLAAAQDESEGTPLVLGDFNIQGSTTAGYRFETLNGYAPEFRELFDLGRGFRLLDLNFMGDSQDGKNPFADTFSLQLSNLGGDPFPTAQFTVSKKKLYDLRVDWRQSYFFLNPNDSAVLPIAPLVTGYAALPANKRTGLTSNHDWDTVRKFGSVDFTLHATNNLRFTFEYYRPSDEGTTFTTRSPDFFGSPAATWGGYARGFPYFLMAPIDDQTNRFTGGIDYTWRTWTFHYNIGYQTFTENMFSNNVTSPEASIDPVTTTTSLTSYTMTEYRRLTTPISEFSFVGKPIKKLEWRGGYIYYRYQGPVNFDQEFSGFGPSGTPAPAYTVTESGRAILTEPNNIVTQGLTYHFFDWWSADVDYRYSRFTSDSVGSFTSLFNGAAPAPPPTNPTDVIWRDGLSDLDISMDFTPIRGLTIRPGIQLMKSDVESLQNTVTPTTLTVQTPITLRTKTARPEISVGYEPSKLFSVRGDFHSLTNGAEYTDMTPHTEQGAHFVVRVHPTDKISIEDESRTLNDRLIARTNFNPNFQNNVRANAVTVSYSLSDRLSVFGGFSYESYYAQGNIAYARGTAPLNDFLRDQELNRVWQGGIELKPVKRAGLRLTGNFDRSSGVGAILGEGPDLVPATYNEPPAYGPVTWPLVTGTGYYDFPVAGRLAIDLQRTYYSEQIVTANNFSGNLLTIRWTKSF